MQINTTSHWSIVLGRLNQTKLIKINFVYHYLLCLWKNVRVDNRTGYVDALFIDLIFIAFLVLQIINREVY